MKSRQSCREFFEIDRSPGRQILDFRKQGLAPVRLLGRYRYSQAHHELAAHSHGQMLEICYLESGRQIYEVKGEEFSLAGGDVFVAFPGERHGTGHHPEARGILYWLLISVPETRRSFLNLPPGEGRALLRMLLRIPRRAFHGRPTLQPTLRAIFETYADLGGPLRAVSLRSLLLRFLLDVAASAYERPPAPRGGQIQAVMDHVEANLEQPLVLTELASRAGLSLPRLKSKFKQEAGLSPADYILRRRIERAAQLLHDTREPITRIALRLGFSSSQYFATVFRRYTLCSPSEARQRRLKF